jgi:peptidoglycan/xylan/chitin deacetylase (PgdA/CDA1 family)
MHHQILPNGGGDFDQTPAQFRSELEQLWRDGYYPVRAGDLVSGRLDVPAGKSPVVLTFDDSTNNQLAFLGGGRLTPNSAIGILESFSHSHPGFPATGTFFVLRQPFTGNGSTSTATLRWLAAHGFELGDHTKDHLPLNGLDDKDVQRELVLGRHVIVDAVPGYRVRIMALPLGAYPRNGKLAVHGAWGGETYSFDAVFLAGAEPSHSPFSVKFDPSQIPRIGTFDNGPTRNGMEYWLDLLKQEPSLRYVSDGDPKTISFPRDEEQYLGKRFRSRANAY